MGARYARVCLMSQRADGRLIHATAPHAACYFYIRRAIPGIIQSRVALASCMHPRQQLSLEVTDSEAGWPVIDSDFK